MAEVTDIQATPEGTPVAISEGGQCAYSPDPPDDGDSEFEESCRKLYDKTYEEN